jgi:hypothetical protein
MVPPVGVYHISESHKTDVGRGGGATPIAVDKWAMGDIDCLLWGTIHR